MKKLLILLLLFTFSCNTIKYTYLKHPKNVYYFEGTELEYGQHIANLGKYTYIILSPDSFRLHIHKSQILDL